MDTVISLLEASITSQWFLPVLFLAVAADAILPTVPAETLLITAGAYAAAGTTDLLPAAMVAMLGAVAGDVICHHIGRGAHRSSGLLRRFSVSRRALAWTDRALRHRGGQLLISARFIPGGRTAATFTSGYVRYPRLRFLLYAAIGGVLWSAYIAGIGFLGGLTFEDRPLVAIGLGILVAVVVSVTIELIRHLCARRRDRTPGQAVHEGGVRTESHSPQCVR